MAYYSSQGVTIHQGAAGLGEFYMSMGQASARAASRGTGYRGRPILDAGEGILSGLGQQVAPRGPSRAPSPAARKFVEMGCHQDCIEEFDGGFWTEKGVYACCGSTIARHIEECVQGARIGNPDAIECLAYWRDEGIITPRGYSMVVPRPRLRAAPRRTRAMRGIGELERVEAWRDGVFSNPDVISEGILQAYREGSLGQVQPTTLDLKDPKTLSEVKTAIAIAAGQPTQENAEKWNQEFFTSEIWDLRATELWKFYLSFIKTRVPGLATVPDTELTVTTAQGEYPTARGMMTALTTGVGSPGFPGNPNYFISNFPKLSAWMQNVAAAGGQGQVLEPNFTFGETIKGKPGALKMSTVALFGLGAAAIVTGYVILRKRRPGATPNRRRRAA